MLYGKKEVVEKILDIAQEIAKQRNIKLVFGAVTGSISRGLSVYDSDYDMRFLYISRDGENKYNVDFEKESDIVYRYFPNAEERKSNKILHLTDRMAFWEFNSFLNFSHNPSLGVETLDKNGLYYIVEHTFRSPYVWDPYGIQQIVLSVLDNNYKKNHILLYYINIVSNRFNNADLIVGKDYTDAIWAALSINWVLSKDSCAPVHIQNLLMLLENSELKSKIKKILHSVYEKYKNYCTLNKSQLREISKDKVVAALRFGIDVTDFTSRGLSRNEVCISRIEEIDMFINEMKIKALREVEIVESFCGNMKSTNVESYLPEIYDIIYHQKVEGVD